jgi:UDP-3-O-[3-hydroxymyristoyl] N-acetylglucosamine deacetylase
MTKQKTIKKEISFEGVGLHSGISVKVTLKSLPENSGIIFKRIDLNKNNEIPALYNNVSNTMLGTTISNKNAVVQTIEHFMAALWACDLDNLLVEINGQEMPILDGSAISFINEVKRAEILEQDAEREYFIPTKETEFSEANKLLKITPSNDDFNVNIEVEYKYGGIGKQTYFFDGNRETFIKEIALARTFCNYTEIENMKRLGFAKGGTEENAAIYDDTKIMNKSGLRCENEVVKHKLIDLIGDLFTSGHYMKGKFDAVWNGHTIHNKFLRKLLK